MKAKSSLEARQGQKVRSGYKTVTVGCEHAHWCADCLVTTCSLYKRVVAAVRACFVARRR